MNELNIVTKLELEPKSSTKGIRPACLITRGSSFGFTFDLSDKVYTFDQIEQLIFVFGTKGKVVKSYRMYATEPIHGEAGILDSHFKHTPMTGLDFITFTLNAEDTAAFASTKPGQWLDCEIVIKLDGDDFSLEKRNTTTIIEKQPAIGIIDSLYGNLLGD